MQHGILLMSLLGLLIVSIGGVFLLVNQDTQTSVLQEESLVGGIGFIEEEAGFPEEAAEENADVDMSSSEPAGRRAEERQPALTMPSAPVNSEGTLGAEREKAEAREEAGKEKMGNIETAPFVEVLTTDAPDAQEKETAKAQMLPCEIASGVQPRRESVVFSEIAWMGTANSAQDEWMELWNFLGREVNMGGWQILDKEGQIEVVFGEKQTIPSDGFFLLERTDDTSVLHIASDLLYVGTLGNASEALYLFDSRCVLQDMAVADPDWPAGDRATGRTMERMPSLEWQTSLDPGGTPKAPNSAGYKEPGEPQEEYEGEPSGADAPQEFSPFQEGPTGGTAEESEQPPEKININTAGFEELQNITGVGPIIAQRIIDYREANGPFQRTEDIKNVDGIGDVNYEAMKDQITVGEAQAPEPLPPEESAPEPAPTPSTSSGGCQEGQIDINSAPKEELVQIIHIGDTRADELILLRPFSSLDDLTRISGIGEQRVADIKAQGLACVG